MTTQEIIDSYANLLIVQYRGKPKAYATVQAQVGPVIMDQLPTKVQDAFNLNGASPAIGVQLDTIGKYCGVVRTGYGISGEYVSLSDADFLSLILFAIIINNIGSSLSEIQQALLTSFAGAVIVFDYQNMQMSYLVDSTIGSQDLLQIVISNGLLPKPMGVQLASVIYASIINAFFGFRTYLLPAHNASPFNNYITYTMTWPWLSYQNAIQPLRKLLAEDLSVLTQENGDLLYID